ncbi:hypothetical protein BDW02DRAFT_603599 [Decorospora gaudefroyi]|uniref:C6 finger domain-containing protein n=1 Tax=Decorospora gaudefroyi TaxID=184978 RepID=A0A6A5JVA2_9PLEO|nr:hypothetical protein BDW02DRAFT_603599 [Decorospora gaudefroyi]
MENQHIDFDGAIYGVDGAFDPSFDPNRQTYNFSHTWPLPISPGTMSQQQQQQQQHDGGQQQQQQQHQQQHQNQNQRRINTVAASTAHNPHPSATSIAPLHTMNLGFPAAMQPMNPMLATWMNINSNTDGFGHDSYGQGSMGMGPDFGASYGGPLQTSPVEFGINASQVMMNSMSMAPMNFMTTTAMDGLPTLSAAPFQMADFQHEFTHISSAPDYTANSNAATANSVSTGSPGENWMEIRSLSSSDNGWVDVGFSHRNSYDYSDSSAIINPAHLHIRTGSDSSTSNQSDVPPSAHSFSSFEEIHFPNMHSPQSEADNTLELVHSHTHSDNCNHSHALPLSDHDFSNYISPTQSVSPPMARVEPIVIKQTSSNTASPTSSAVSSPPVRRRKSPVGATGAKPAKTIVKKTPAHTTKKDATGEKRVGRRKGPLRPDQRQQAHEIRKLRACLRCKFLKKTCDKGDPCAGCQPSHARLWQVPCTRIDIKDIAYFMKDWKADYERHVSLGFSIGNIKGFSTSERLIYVTHGYGHYLPIMARDVYVRDEKCFGVDWHETLNGLHFEINTAKLSAGMEGISHAMLSDYLDRHIDGGFEQFVDEYFEGTYFVTELLKTAYRFYCREKLPVIRKALKLVLAYNLTLHVTMVEGLGEEDNTPGKVEDQHSKFSGKTIAPVMINFQVKCALADMWRELQKDVLEELSSLYQSVYSGDKLKNWPTIFMLAAILLAVWELIQFDCNYRVPDIGAVNKFCGEMEGTPVGVIVGLFSAISQKLPSFTEWDSRKHHHLLNSNPAVCDAMTEVRAHVTKYETYLRSRSDCKFDRQDFDSLSNKFLSKLVIRAN